MREPASFSRGTLGVQCQRRERQRLRGCRAVGIGKGKDVACETVAFGPHDMKANWRGGGCGLEARRVTLPCVEKEAQPWWPARCKIEGEDCRVCHSSVGRNDVEAVSRVVGCAAEAPRGHTAMGGNSSAGEANGEAGKGKGGGSRSYSPSPLAMTRR